ncbi:hypothetical protein ACM9HF_14065 [Colwellia sp. RE-S-Sl-9]
MKIINIKVTVFAICLLLLVVANTQSNANAQIEVKQQVGVATIEEEVKGYLTLIDETSHINTTYISGKTMYVSVAFEAGSGNQVDGSGIQFFLREMTPAWEVVHDINIHDSTVIGDQNGTSTVAISLNGIKPTADLSAGNFYFLFASFISSDGITHSIDGVGNIKIEADPTIVLASLTLDNKYKYYKRYTTDGTIDVVANYNAGTGHTVANVNGGVRFMLREMTPDWLVVNDFVVADSHTIGTQSGIAMASISLAGVTPTADLPDDNFYLIFSVFKSTDGNLYSISGVAPIYIVAGDGRSDNKIVEPLLSLDNNNKYYQTYHTDKTIDVVAHYNAGKGHTVMGTHGGVSFMLREMTSNWTVVKDVVVNDMHAVGTQSGTAKASIPLNKLTPTAYLPAGNFYFLFASFESSNGNKYDIPGITPINLVSDNGDHTPSLTLNDKYKYYQTYYTGGTIDVAAKYNAGEGHKVTKARGGVRFLLREMTSSWVVVNDIVVDDSSAIGNRLGTARGSIPLVGVTPTANLPEGNFYLLFSIFESTDGKKYSISGITPIEIEAETNSLKQ